MPKYSHDVMGNIFPIMTKNVMQWSKFISLRSIFQASFALLTKRTLYHDIAIFTLPAVSKCRHFDVVRNLWFQFSNDVHPDIFPNDRGPNIVSIIIAVS